jgi:hypothetical protein
MTIHENADLHKRVERYEAAVDELRAAHQDIKDVLTAQVLFERWQQIGGELGFSTTQQPPLSGEQPHQNLIAVNQMPEMSDSWAS